MEIKKITVNGIPYRTKHDRIYSVLHGCEWIKKEGECTIELMYQNAILKRTFRNVKNLIRFMVAREVIEIPERNIHKETPLFFVKKYYEEN